MISSAKTLVVSFIGMKSQELDVKSNLHISLKPDTETLDEVVVVAYGAAKKNSLTGSVATVKSDALEKVPTASFEKALQGLSAGVQVESQSGQPGSVSQVRIRGIGSMSASSQPLYVIDGVPVSSKNISKVADEDSYGTSVNPLSNLNPNDIESISVLKDASAASLYGSRAANGVVMITTKQGASGQAKIEFKAQVSSSHLPSNGYDLMSSTEHYKTYYKGFYTQNISDGMTSEAASIAANASVQDMYKANPFNMANPFTGEGILASGAKAMINTDYLDELFKTATTQQYDLSISGGSDKSKYFISLGYMDQDGLAVGSDLSRYSARINVSSKIKPWAEIGVTSTMSVNEQNTPPGGGGGSSPLTNAFFVPNAISLYKLDNDFNKIYDEKGNPVYNYVNPVFNDMNTLAFSKMDIYNTKTHRALISPFIDLNIFGVHWRNSFSYDYTNMDEMRWYNPEHGNGAAVDGRLSKYAISDITSTFTSTLNYAFSLFNDHHIGLLAGYEAYKNTYSMLHAHATGFSNSEMIELSMASTPYETKSKKDHERMQSFFGRINYDFDNKYYLSASIRSDESSKFHPDHRRGTFWSVGGSWRLTQEEFLKDVEWLSNLKLKASYGTQGNDGILDINGYVVYQPYLKQYSVTNNNGDFSVVETYRGNKDLTWEKSKNLNIGLEAAFLNNRLKLETEYFLKKTSDMLYNMPYPISSGISYVPMNLLDMQNKGIEFTISATPIQTKDFIWNLSFNGTHYSNKILNLPEDKRENGIIHGTASLFRLMEGGSIYDLYTYEYAGVNPETGAAQWYMDEKDANGKVTGRTVTEDYTQASKYELGSTLPDFQGGFSTDFAYKGIDLSIATNFQIGGKIYDSMYSSFMHAGSNIGSNWHKDILNAWTPENKNTNVPIMDGAQNSNSQSSRFLINASFFNIRNISLGYTFPKEWMKAISASSARIYVSADNVALFSKRKGMDPRQYAYGYSAANYSAIRTLSFGINLNF